MVLKELHSFFIFYYFMSKRLFDIIGTALLFIGFFLAFLPHTMHVSIGFDEETSHLKHIIFGIIFVIVALIILIYNNNALNLNKKV